jgi:N-acetylglucosamine kinase-like BadF-type ATPase
VGADLALRHLHEAVRAAFDQAGLPCAPVAAACLGLAGAGRPEDQAVIRDWASRVYLAEHVNVTTDADLLLAAGTADGWGLALIAGTGSMAFGRHADGRTARAGGWGHLLGDEGSGYALVVSGLRAVACAADGRGPATRLTEALLSGMGVSAPAGLIAEVYGGDWDRARLAGLASVVLETAARGDTVASDLVSRAARQLAETAAAVVRALTFVEQPLPVALAGGVLVSSEMYRAKVLEAFADVGIHTARVTVVADPAEGAVLLAMKRPINV